MAGTYPDVPGYRFAYDKDGTTMVTYSQAGTGLITTRTATDMQRANQNQSGANFTSGNSWLALIFPEVRTVLGYYININHDLGPGRILQSSTDTTNGQDGTWSTIANPFIFDNGDSIDVSPGYRSNIQPINAPNIIALRMGLGYSIRAFHLYGSIATTESPDRLRIVDLSGDDIAAQFDFGDIRQRNNVTKQFKVINNSATKTANNITVTLDTNPDASPTLIGQYQLSTDNTAFANAINIGTLAPGASSGALYVRDTISATAQLGPWAVRLIASANTWS